MNPIPCTRKQLFPVIMLLFAILWIFNCFLYAQDNKIILPDDPLKGRVIFEKKGCEKCHAVFGYGGNYGPDLGQSNFYGNLLDLAGIMWNHSPRMKRNQSELPEFSKDEMLSLLAFLYFLSYIGNTGDAQNGEQLLNTKGCLECHSLNEIGQNHAVDLSYLGRFASPLYMAQDMWNHTPDMALKLQNLKKNNLVLSGQDIADMSAFIRQTNPVPTHERVYMNPGNPENGKQIFEQKKCSKCHPHNDNIQNHSAPDLEHSYLGKSSVEIAASLWNHGQKMYKSMQEKEITYPRFKGNEMADLLAFLYFLAAFDSKGQIETGKTVFHVKRCSHCHEKQGDKKSFGPNVHEMIEDITPISMVQTMWNHSDDMLEIMMEHNLIWPEFDRDEMNHLYTYLRSIKNELPKSEGIQ